MRALKIIRQKVEKGTKQVHKARRNAVWRTVEALLIGRMLWSAALGRHRPGNATEKNSIKAVDRLLGNCHLYAELRIFYAAVVQAILKKMWKPVILVDITEIHDGVCALTASLAHDGRGVPVFNMVCSKKNVSKRRFKRRFLRRLATILPAGVEPILVTDAGFQSTWFDDVVDMNWDYVGRVRHRTKFLLDDEWVSCQDLHKIAKKQAQDLGGLPFPRETPKARRMILSKARTGKGRKRMNQKGRKGRTTTDRRCSQSAREPWLLATSLSSQSASVVGIYALRMQIEENYRDAKNKRWGWSLDQCKTTKRDDYTRYEILLLVATLGVLVQHSVGCAGEKKGLQRQFQANTIRNRRVISIFVLGSRLLSAKHEHVLKVADIIAGFEEFRQRVQYIGSEAAP